MFVLQYKDGTYHTGGKRMHSGFCKDIHNAHLYANIGAARGVLSRLSKVGDITGMKIEEVEVVQRGTRFEVT